MRAASLSFVTTIPNPGRTPRQRFLLFPFGTTHTDKYGPIEVDHADAIAVMHEYERRGRRLASDVEHAYHDPVNKPASWQESHGWHGLEVDYVGIHALADWNDNGKEKLTSRTVAYDSPAITTWRGNQLRSIEMISLVKDPARDGSIPLCMNNATTPAASQPTGKVKVLQRLHGALGEVVAAMNAGQSEQDLREVNESLAKLLIDPMAKVNELLQQSGAATLKDDGAADAGKPEAKTAGEAAPPPKTMSAKPDPLAELGAEILTKLGAKTIDEARGKLQALQDNNTTLMSAQKTATRLLLLNGLHEAKVSPDEVKQYEAESPEFVTALLANRVARVNTKPAAAQQAAADASDAGVDKNFVGAVEQMIHRTMGVKL